MLPDLEEYIATLSALGGLATRLLLPPSDDPDISFLTDWPSIEERVDVRWFFSRVPGYSNWAVRLEKRALSDAPFIVGEVGLTPYYSPVPIKRLRQEMDFRDVFFDAGVGSSDNSYNYVGIGFVPFLTDHNGSYQFVNCDPQSSTFGAIYTLYEGIGSVRIANDINHYFQACHQLLKDGVYFVDEWGGLNVRREDEYDAWLSATGLGTTNGEVDW